MENKITRVSTSNIDIQKKEEPRNYNILVYIRIRPVLKTEFGKEVVVNPEDDGKSIALDNKNNIIQSTYDRVFDQKSNQLDIFEQVKDFIPAVIEGYNCTVFAYGQTGSGKTHTMFGSDWEQLVCEMQINRTNMQTTYVENVKDDRYFSGLIPRMIFDIFREIDTQDKKESHYAVYCCFLQIYNEKVYDLLQDKFATNPLEIRENKIDGIYVEGLTEYFVNNYKECINLMQRGERNRFIRSTSSNIKSSRSHTIFQIIVETTRADKKGRLQKAKLNLCDLAGSEKIKKTEAVQGAHLTELKNINLSLTTLGKVIHTLSQSGKKPTTIPYRESKLTRLLQDSLGGNTRTCLIATVSPVIDCVDETSNTLKFAERAQHIITVVKQNKINAVDQDLVNKLQLEIKYLKDILNMRRKGTSVNEVHHKLLLLQEENDRLRKAISIQEVEGLIEENKKMKLELQALRNSTQAVNQLVDEEINDAVISAKLPDFGFYGGSDQKENNSEFVFDDARYRKGFTSTDSRQKSNSTTVDKLNTSDINKPRSSATSSTVNASNRLTNPNSLSGLSNETGNKQIFQRGQIHNLRKFTPDEFSPTQVRVRGKKNDEHQDTKSMLLGKSPNMVQYVDTRRKEQNRALERLKELEYLQKKHQEKMKGYVLEERSQNPLVLNTPNKFEREEQSPSKFDGQINLKEVRKNVHEKYKNPTKTQLEEIKAKSRETQQNRYKNIEKNFVGIQSPISSVK